MLCAEGYPQVTLQLNIRSNFYGCQDLLLLKIEYIVWIIDTWCINLMHSLILRWRRLWTAPNQMKFMYAPVYCSCAIVNHWSDMRSHDSQNWFDDTINNIDCEARLDRWCQHFAQIRSTRCLLCQFHSDLKFKISFGNCNAICNAHKFQSSSIDDSMVYLLWFWWNRSSYHLLKVFQNFYIDIINIELSLFVLINPKDLAFLNLMKNKALN